MLSSPDSRSPSPEVSIRKRSGSTEQPSNQTRPPFMGLSTAGYGNIGGVAHYSDHSFQRHRDGTSDILVLESDDATFLSNDNEAVQQKIAAASGAVLTTTTKEDGQQILKLVGDERQRARARDYVRIMLKQRVGKIEVDFTTARDDRTRMEIPLKWVGYVTGRNSHHLHKTESDCGVIMLFPKKVCI
jgi:hypothetical protein